MARTPRQQSEFDLESLRFQIQNGYPEDKSLWTVEQRQDFIRYMSAFIQANAQIFDPADVDHARKAGNLDFGKSVDASYFTLENLGIFVAEGSRQGQRINPLSEENRRTTSLYIVGGIFALGAVMIITNKITK